MRFTRVIERTGIFPVLFAFALWLCPARRADAQFYVRTWLPWRTVETPHFAFHYPTELEAWTVRAASRVEAIDSAVTTLVGYRPPHKTQVVVDDPYEIANGSAWPMLDQPAISLWATPPDPREDISEFGVWSDMLISHEFGHIAHLSRPSRNPAVRLFWSLSPANIGPLTLKAPRWVIEGYATYVEGRVTGSGRPHGAWRAAFLRQWALEGQLPRYDQLDASGAFEGGSFAYLAGSAFLEWLAARQPEGRGDSSLVYVWRRMSARQDRAFDEAFTGVFGESPRALYGRFTADVTSKATEAARLLRSAGADSGTIEQRLARATGDPAISPDGKRIAIVVRSAVAPSRVVIWGTQPEPDTGRARRDSLLLARDPEDVPGRSAFPPPKRVLASLTARGGASYENPRFLNDGRVLLTRSTSQGDGSLRPDLYLWNPTRRSVHRVTRGASLSDADPMPDGRTAVATRCHSGWCDLVQVDLANGTVTNVVDGTPEVSFFRPRVRPKAREVVVSMHIGDKWHLGLVNIDTHALTRLAIAGDANHYDATWLSATELVGVSDGSGVPQLERITLGTLATRTLTHVTGAAVAPEPNATNDKIWFLTLYSGGYDLRSIPSSKAAGNVVTLPASLVPAAPVPSANLKVFAPSTISAPRRYNATPTVVRWFPQPDLDADGIAGVLALVGTDVVGRTELLAQGAWGDASMWRGGALAATWRGTRPFPRLQLFGATQRPSESRSSGAWRPQAALLDSHLTGAELTADATRQYDTWAARLRLGANAAHFHLDSVPPGEAADGSSRVLAFGDGAVAFTQRSGGGSVTESLSGNGAIGRTLGSQFSRGLFSAALSAHASAGIGISASAFYGRVSGGGPFEAFAIGGNAPSFLDRASLAQRIEMPALPTAISIGSSVLTYRVALPTQPLSLFVWGGSTTPAGERFSRWNRVIGFETTQRVSAIPVIGTPPARLRLGAGESLDAPFRHQLRAYLSLVLEP